MTTTPNSPSPPQDDEIDSPLPPHTPISSISRKFSNGTNIASELSTQSVGGILRRQQQESSAQDGDAAALSGISTATSTVSSTASQTPSKTQRIVQKLLSLLLSGFSIVFFVILTGFLINKICQSTVDKNRLSVLDLNEIQFHVNYTSKDNLFSYEHRIFVSCRYEGKKSEEGQFDRIVLFDGSMASTHASAQMMGKIQMKKYQRLQGEDASSTGGSADGSGHPSRMLFCSYDRIGRGNSITKKTLLDSKNRFTVRHIDKDLYVKQNIVRYALAVARALHKRFRGKLMLMGHGFGANVQSAVVTSMTRKDKGMVKGLILLDPILGDEMRHYIRRQTNWGLFYTLTGAMRLMTQIMRIQLPMRVVGVTSLGGSKYLSDNLQTRRNLLLCQQKLWESARDEVDLFPALHSLVLYRERRFIGQIPVYILTSELIDPSDEDLNAAYASIVPTSQYVRLSKYTSHKTVPHVSTSEIVDRVDYISEAMESVDPSLKELEGGSG